MEEVEGPIAEMEESEGPIAAHGDLPANLTLHLDLRAMVVVEAPGIHADFQSESSADQAKKRIEVSLQLLQPRDYQRTQHWHGQVLPGSMHRDSKE